MTYNLNEFTQGAYAKRVSVTIPANAATAVTMASLAALTLDEQDRLCIGMKVLGLDTGGASRAAFLVGHSTSATYQYVAASADYIEPVTTDHTRSYFKAASGGAIANVCVVFYLIGA